MPIATPRLAASAGLTTPLMAPSMLKCDYGNLLGEITRLEAGGAEVLHWDVMDGHFVPNLTYGAVLLESVRKHTNLFFDAHLMISDPAKYLGDYLKAGCDAITFHIEAVPQPDALLQEIRRHNVLAGLAVNPKTPIQTLEPWLDLCDLVLVMSVEPGFGGQSFMPDMLEKVRWLKGRVAPGTRLSIDGGIGAKTIASAAQAGCGMFVAGSAIFDAADYGVAIRDLTRLAASSSREL